MDIHISGCLLLQNNSGQQKSAEFYLLCSALLSVYCAEKAAVKSFFTVPPSFFVLQRLKRKPL